MSTTLMTTDESELQSNQELADATNPGDQVELMVELGHTMLTLAEVQQLRPGAMICLDEYLQDPVTIFAGSKLLGRGEILLIEGQMGVRVTELYPSQAEA